MANGNGTWKNSLIHAGLAAGAAFFGVLTGMGIAGGMGDGRAALVAGFIAAGGAFFASFAMPNTNHKPKVPDGP